MVERSIPYEGSIPSLDCYNFLDGTRGRLLVPFLYMTIVFLFVLCYYWVVREINKTNKLKAFQMTSILFFTTTEPSSGPLNTEYRSNGGSLEPLKKKFALTPMAVLKDVSDDTLNYFYKDNLILLKQKNYFILISGCATAGERSVASDDMTKFLIHSLGKLLKRAFPLKLKSLISGKDSDEVAELKDIVRQNEDLGNLSKQFTKYNQIRRRSIVAMVV